MIEHCRDRWADDERPRRWGAHVSQSGVPVLLRHYAVLEPGEDLTEYPPTIELDWAEWVRQHADYGLTIDGTPA